MAFVRRKVTSQAQSDKETVNFVSEVHEEICFGVAECFKNGFYFSGISFSRCLMKDPIPMHVGEREMIFSPQFLRFRLHTLVEEWFPSSSKQTSLKPHLSGNVTWIVRNMLSSTKTQTYFQCLFQNACQFSRKNETCFSLLPNQHNRIVFSSS